VPVQKNETFGYHLDLWLKQDQKGKRTSGEAKRLIEKETKDWKDRPLRELTRKEIIAKIDEIAEDRPTLARNFQGRLHRMLKWCALREHIEANPLAGVPKPGEAVHRERALSDAELKAAWNAAGRMTQPFDTAIKLLILTGTRREDIGALEWRQVDLPNAILHIPAKMRGAKEDDIIDVPLSPMAVRLLKAMPRVKDCPYVFSITGRTPISGWSKIKRRLDAAMIEMLRGPSKGANDDILPGWVIHDFRRSIASWLEGQGEQLLVVEAVLQHTTGSKTGVAKIYLRHRYAKEKRKAVEAWANHVRKLTAPKLKRAA
jgi:integrase